MAIIIPMRVKIKVEAFHKFLTIDPITPVRLTILTFLNGPIQ